MANGCETARDEHSNGFCVDKLGMRQNVFSLKISVPIPFLYWVAIQDNRYYNCLKLPKEPYTDTQLGGVKYPSKE